MDQPVRFQHHSIVKAGVADLNLRKSHRYPSIPLHYIVPNPICQFRKGAFCMKFDSAIGLDRPVRLSQATRTFAWESLNARYGKEALENGSVPLDGIPGVAGMAPLDQYDLAIREIAQKAPLRLCPGELLSGAATLGGAIFHDVPATLNGKRILYGVSHLTADFAFGLEHGLDALEDRIASSRQAHQGQPDRLRFLESAQSCLESFRIWHRRYLDALEGPLWTENRRALEQVPFRPARSFREAVQSIWFQFAFLRLCGTWPGIGRIDLLLGKYLKADLEAGVLTLNEAREILAHFFIKGCEWITGQPLMTGGDAQHYQNLVLSGVDSAGADVTNDVTYLVLDVVEELGISDFPISVRINANTPPRLLTRMAEVIRHGGGIIAVYGEDTVLKALTGMGYPLEEARRFANDGCWEVQVPGSTFFGYLPFDSLHLLQETTLHGYDPAGADYETFEDLYRQYVQDLRDQVWKVTGDFLRDYGIFSPDGSWDWTPSFPPTAVSLFENGCIESARDYRAGGPKYKVISPHIGGLPDTVNSLYAIKKLVFDEKKLSLADLLAILRNNWEGEEPLRQYVSSHYEYYGNDSDESDALAARLLEDFSAICGKLYPQVPIRFPAGVSTFGRQIEWAPGRLAAPFGRKQGEILAANLSPTPGSDEKGATAVIRSYCKIDLPRLACGAALDVTLLPGTVKGPHGVDAITGLIRGFAALGGFFMQMDVTDPAVLRKAQEHPDEYRNLSVRVSGWSARFVTLSREWQQMIIERDAQGRIS